MKLQRKPDLRLVEPIEEYPPPRFELPPLREVFVRIARAAVITVAVMIACAYVLIGAQLVLQLYRQPEPLMAFGIALLSAFILFVGIRIVRMLSYQSIGTPGDAEAAVVYHEHHHHHHQAD
jgi:hypothetical protein